MVATRKVLCPHCGQSLGSDFEAQNIDIYDLMRRHMGRCPSDAAKAARDEESGIQAWEAEHQQEMDEERYGHDTPTEEEIDQMFADYDNCIAKDLEDDRGMIGD